MYRENINKKLLDEINVNRQNIDYLIDTIDDLKLQIKNLDTWYRENFYDLQLQINNLKGNQNEPQVNRVSLDGSLLDQ
jgi:tRNA A37 threonylcarbamoyladenosine dehydratase